MTRNKVNFLSKISMKGDEHISNCLLADLHHKNANFEYDYPYSNVLFNYYTSKTHYFLHKTSPFSAMLNHFVDHSIVALLMMSGFGWYIAVFTVTNS